MRDLTPTQKLLVDYERRIVELSMTLQSYKPYLAWLANSVHVKHHNLTVAWNFENCPEKICESVISTIRQVDTDINQPIKNEVANV